MMFEWGSHARAWDNCPPQPPSSSPQISVSRLVCSFSCPLAWQSHLLLIPLLSPTLAFSFRFLFRLIPVLTSTSLTDPSSTCLTLLIPPRCQIPVHRVQTRLRNPARQFHRLSKVTLPIQPPPHPQRSQQMKDHLTQRPLLVP